LTVAGDASAFVAAAAAAAVPLPSTCVMCRAGDVIYREWMAPGRQLQDAPGQRARLGHIAGGVA